MDNVKNEITVSRLQRQANFERDKEFFLVVLQRFLIILSVGLLLAVAAGAFNLYYQYYFAGEKDLLNEQLLLSVNNPKYLEQVAALKAENLRISSNKVLENFKGNYDLLSYLTNPNKDWYALIDYHFESGAYKGQMQQSFVLPQQNRPLWDLNVPSTQKLSSGKLVLDKVEWYRASRYDELRAEYWNFSVDDIKLSRGRDIEGADEDSSRLSFIVSNASIYNFWKLGLAISLKRYDDVVAFYYYELTDLLAGEKRPISLTFFEDLPGITDISVVPLLNVFDADNIYSK